MVALANLPHACIFNHEDPSSYNVKNISGSGLDRTVDGGNLTYSYTLKEYRNIEELPGTTMLYSSANCIGRRVHGNKVYEKGKQVGSLLCK